MGIQVKSNKECLDCKIHHWIELPLNVTEARFKNDLQEVNVGGASIQHQLSYLTAEQREMLITGYCDKAWNKIFGEER